MPASPPTARVGSLVLAALIALAVGIFFIGEQNNLFRSKNQYRVRFSSVSGLADGNPVQLSGVRVGRVSEIVLPRDPKENQLSVHLEIDSRFAARIRKDSLARIKTLGLLGDKFVEITSGSAGSEVIPDGGEIRAAPPTDVDQLIHSGEDVVENIVRISHTLVTLLERIENGEGVLGQLLADQDMDGRSLPTELFAAVERAQDTLALLEDPRTPLGRLLHDEELGNNLAGAVDELHGLVGDVRTGDGLAAALIYDEELKNEAQRTLANLEDTSVRLETLATNLESGDGLLPRLLNDGEEADRILGEIETFVQRLNEITRKIDEGDGTVAQLIEDPSLYEAMNDIVVGVNESRLLRWLIRNRQKKGIEARYEEESGGAPPPPEQPSGTPSQEPSGTGPSGP